jgi:hypothetical protein
MCMCVRVHVHAHARVCVRACARARVCVCVENVQIMFTVLQVSQMYKNGKSKTCINRLLKTGPLYKHWYMKQNIDLIKIYSFYLKHFLIWKIPNKVQRKIMSDKICSEMYCSSNSNGDGNSSMNSFLTVDMYLQ